MPPETCLRREDMIRTIVEESLDRDPEIFTDRTLDMLEEELLSYED